jgi:hypothetical protein
MRAINKDKIVEAFIRKPYKNTGENWDHESSHGWQVVLVIDISPEATHYIIDKESEEECIEFINSLGFIIV